MARPKKVEVEKVQNCYYCDGVIESFNDMAFKKFPVVGKNGKKIQRNRQFHLNCLLKFNQDFGDLDLRGAEYSDWDKLYQYVKLEIFGLPTKSKLDGHTIKRLLGLRLGKYYPKGNNTLLLKRGYDFETILITFKLLKPKIKHLLETSDIKDAQHATNLMMKIVISEINDIQMRIEKQKKSNAKLKEDENVQRFDYKEELKKQKAEQEDKKTLEVNPSMKLLFGDEQL